MPVKQDHRVVFAVGKDEDGERVVVLGVSKAAFAHMKDGKTHTFDLARVGVPLKIILFGGRTREACKRMIPTGPGTIDRSDQEFGIE